MPRKNVILLSLLSILNGLYLIGKSPDSPWWVFSIGWLFLGPGIDYFFIAIRRNITTVSLGSGAALGIFMIVAAPLTVEILPKTSGYSYASIVILSIIIGFPFLIWLSMHFDRRAYLQINLK